MQITAVGADDISRALGKLEHFDEIATRHWKEAMKGSVKPIAATARATVPVESGKWQRSIGSRVTGKGTKIQGKIGSFMTEWYPNVVEHGAKAHTIGKGGSSAHVLIKGAWKTITEHPGFAGRLVFKNAFQRWRFWVTAEFTVANEAISEELARK
jgi:hypothetical protein